MFQAEFQAKPSQDATGYFSEKVAEAADMDDAEAKIVGSLDDKIATVHALRGAYAGSRIQRLISVVAEAQGIWQQRHRLSREDCILLAAALLYFISSVDAIPDVIPGIGYVDDLTILIAVLNRLRQAIKAFVAEIIQENVDEVLVKVDSAANASFDRMITTISIGFWAATSVAAISVAISQATNGLPPAWQAYLLVASGLALLWNGVAAIDVIRRFHELDEPWRLRIVTVIAGRFGWMHVLKLGLPAVLLLAFSAVRILGS